MDLADILPNDTIIWLSHTKTHPAVRFFSPSLILGIVKQQYSVSLFWLMIENS